MGRVDAAPFCKRAQLGPVGSRWRRSRSIPMGAWSSSWTTQA